MLVKDILNSKKTCISYEFFPPKQEDDWDRLFQTISDLMPLDPAYVSVTYGAGGSTRDRTHDLPGASGRDFKGIDLGIGYSF